MGLGVQVNDYALCKLLEFLTGGSYNTLFELQEEAIVWINLKYCSSNFIQCFFFLIFGSVVYCLFGGEVSFNLFCPHYINIFFKNIFLAATPFCLVSQFFTRLCQYEIFSPKKIKIQSLTQVLIIIYCLIPFIINFFLHTAMFCSHHFVARNM